MGHQGNMWELVGGDFEDRGVVSELPLIIEDSVPSGDLSIRIEAICASSITVG